MKVFRLKGVRMNKFEEYRRRKNMTQSELSKILGWIKQPFPDGKKAKVSHQ